MEIICKTGKKCLKKKECEAILRRKKPLNNRRRAEVRYYRCPECGMSHLTHMVDPPEEQITIDRKYRKKFKKYLL